MARICVVNARNTFAEYQKFLKEIKYKVWNREKAKKDCIVTPSKCDQGGTHKKSSLVKKPLKRGIETNDYYLKLCGSGGGGYILGFTEDIDKAKTSLKGHNLEVVYNF